MGPNLEELHAERRPGRCLVCEAKLRGQKRSLCGEYECQRFYDDVCKKDTYLRKRQNPKAWEALLAQRAKANRALYQRLKAGRMRAPQPFSMPKNTETKKETQSEANAH